MRFIYIISTVSFQLGFAASSGTSIPENSPAGYHALFSKLDKSNSKVAEYGFAGEVVARTARLFAERYDEC